MLGVLLTALSLPFLFGSITIQSYICQPPAVPVIQTPLSGSSLVAGPVTVAGTATASSQVTLSVDGTPAVQVTADQTNAFRAQVTLTTGNHTVGITSTSPCGTQSGSDITLTATAPPTPPNQTGTTPASTAPFPITRPAHVGSSTGNSSPVLTGTGLGLVVTYPTDKTAVYGAAVLVRGTTSQAATVQVTVNGQAVGRTLIPSDSFGLSVPLSVGGNDITVTATSETEQASVNLQVTRLNQGLAAAAPLPEKQSWWQTVPGEVTLVLGAVVLIGLVIWLPRR